VKRHLQHEERCCSGDDATVFSSDTTVGSPVMPFTVVLPACAAGVSGGQRYLVGVLLFFFRCGDIDPELHSSDCPDRTAGNPGDHRILSPGGLFWPFGVYLVTWSFIVWVMLPQK
jgi:hypothetical protein